jgi:hypothetical protein
VVSRGGITARAVQVIVAAADANDEPFRVELLPLARAGVVNFGQSVLIPDTQSSQQRQPGNQHSTTDGLQAK